MKNLTLKMLFIVAAFPIMAVHAKADGNLLSKEGKYEIKAKDVEAKFEDTVLTTEGFLKRFNPSGVTVREKHVDGKDFDYDVVKKALGFAFEVRLIGNINFERTIKGCLSTETAYLGKIEFTEGSDDIVIDGIKSFDVILCAKAVSPTKLSIRTKGLLVYGGEKVGYLVEKIALSTLGDQVGAIMKAITEEVLSKK